MTPRLQIALDTETLPAALAPLQAAKDYIDVIEVGTVLCLSEGMHAVRAIKAAFPDKPVLADIRIVEAGSLLSKLAFNAGADWVSCVAGASMTTIAQVCEVAKVMRRQVQVELGDSYSYEIAKRWRELGVEHVIVKRSRDKEAAGELEWGPNDTARVDELAALGFTVTITGGVTPKDLSVFKSHPVGIVIAGRAIYAAQDPKQAAAELKSAMQANWG